MQVWEPQSPKEPDLGSLPGSTKSPVASRASRIYIYVIGCGYLVLRRETGTRGIQTVLELLPVNCQEHTKHHIVRHHGMAMDERCPKLRDFGDLKKLLSSRKAPRECNCELDQLTCIRIRFFCMEESGSDVFVRCQASAPFTYTTIQTRL